MKQASNSIETTTKSTNDGQQYKILALIILVALLVTVAGFIIYRMLTPRMSSVPSLQNNWGLLEEKAQEWEDDSFLTSARIDVNEHQTYQLITTYYSPSTRKNLSIAIENSGELTTMQLKKRGSYGLRPVRRESWVLDSQEALLEFSKSESVKSCLQSSVEPMEMTLFVDYTNLAVWKLDIWNCPQSGDLGIKSYYLDAQTGELIEHQ
jgi:hypothetical protein